MIIKYFVYHLVRTTPNKILLVSFAWVIIGLGLYHYKNLLNFKEFKFKEKDEKRKFAFQFAINGF